jgi:hypothetical protein
MINQYINQPTSLSHISFIEFVANYDIRTLRKYKKSNVVRWVGFNKHKDSENHYKELLLLFSPFVMTEVSQKQTYSTWHDAYKTKELSIQMVQIKFINAFGANTTNIIKVDWDEIKLTLINWLLKTMTHYGSKIFQIMKTISIFQKETQISY